MSELLVNTIKKADGTGSLAIPAESGTVVVKDGSNDVTLNNITATGVYLGGTGAANYLDDYEEGTFTPTMYGSSSGGGTINAAQVITAKYTKIGNLVHVSIGLNAFNFPNSNTYTGNLRLGGLPFTSTSTATYESAMGDAYFFPSSQWDTITNFTGIVPAINASSDFIGFKIKAVDSNRQSALSNTNTNFSTGQDKYLRFSLTYITDA